MKWEWADYAAVTCKLSGNIRPQSSQLAEPQWTDLGTKKSGISLRELIATSNKQTNEKAQAESRVNGRTFSGKARKRG